MLCICEICGKEFRTTPSKVKAGKAKHCSLKCRNKALKGTHRNIDKLLQEAKQFAQFRKGKTLVETFGEDKGIEVRHRMSQAARGNKNRASSAPRVMKICPVCKQEFWVKPSEAYRRKFCSLRCFGVYKHSHYHQAPNHSEQKLIQLIEQNQLPYRYCGDGTVQLGRCIPDFINVNGLKAVIELFGDYWHTGGLRAWHQTESGRAYEYASFGFQTLVIWENELNTPEQVVKKIKSFTRKVKNVPSYLRDSRCTDS